MRLAGRFKVNLTDISGASLRKTLYVQPGAGVRLGGLSLLAPAGRLPRNEAFRQIFMERSADT